MTSAWKAVAELYKHAVEEGALTGDPTLDAGTIAAAMPDASTQRADLTNTVRALTPVDLLWLRTTVEDELLRRGYTLAPLHKQG
jgi:hypothetical protein